MKFRFGILLLVSVALLSLPAQAQLVNFTFSENVSGGTITGEIEGLSLSGTSTPTEIVITSQPGSYPNGAPIDLRASGYGFYGTSDTFTVSGGTITGANVGIYKQVTGGDYQGYGFDFTSSALGFSNDNGLFLASSVGTTLMQNSNSLGLAGVTYALASVPEPHQTMLIFLLAGVGLLMGRKLHARFLRPPSPNRHSVAMEKN